MDGHEGPCSGAGGCRGSCAGSCRQCCSRCALWSCPGRGSPAGYCMSTAGTRLLWRLFVPHSRVVDRHARDVRSLLGSVVTVNQCVLSQATECAFTTRALLQGFRGMGLGRWSRCRRARLLPPHPCGHSLACLCPPQQSRINQRWGPLRGARCHSALTNRTWAHLDRLHQEALMARCSRMIMWRPSQTRVQTFHMGHRMGVALQRMQKNVWCCERPGRLCRRHGRRHAKTHARCVLRHVCMCAMCACVDCGLQV